MKSDAAPASTITARHVNTNEEEPDVIMIDCVEFGLSCLPPELFATGNS